jgi:hypothetical protein
MRYCLVDKRATLSVVYSSENFYHVLHEYLIKIMDEVRLLHTHNIKTEIHKLSSLNLSVVATEEDDYKPTPFITNRFEFNYTTCQVVCDGGKTVVNIPNTYSFNGICTYISDQLPLIIGEKSSQVVKTTQVVKQMHQTDVRKSGNTVDVRKGVNVPKLAIPEKSQSINKLISETKNMIAKSNAKKIVIPEINLSDQKQDVVIDKYLNYVCQEVGEEPSNDESLTEIDDLPYEIEKLEEMRIQEEELLLDAHEEHQKKMDQYSEYVSKINDEKREIRRQKERIENMRNVFKSDKNTYFIFKKEITDNKRKPDDIPALFAPKYPIFQFMDEKELFDNNDSEDEFELYCSFYEELYPKKGEEVDEEKNYIPHNINYLTEEEQSKYNTDSKQLSDIDAMIEKIRTEKIPPLDEILQRLDQEVEEDADIAAIQIEEDN